MRRKHLLTGVLVATALVLAGCSTKAVDNSKGTAGSDGVKAGPGVSADTIKLGALVDLTAVFAANSKSILQGANLFWNDLNADGGVCGRKVELQVADHAYDPQKGLSVYRDMSSNVLAISPILGSSVITALVPSFQQDHMTAAMAAWTSDVLPNPYLQITGTTYDVEMINAIDYLIQQQRLKPGDTIGHIYFVGDFGGSALKGSLFAAGKHNLKVVQQQIKPSDTDLSAQVGQLKAAGVKAILLSAGSPQTASVASVAAAVGLDVPIIGNGPIFTPELLNTPAKDALEKQVMTVSSIAPPSYDAPGVKKFLTEFQKANPGTQPTQNGSMYGYAAAQIMSVVLQKACENKDLTRDGVQTALHALSGYDSQGTVAGRLGYTDPSVPPTRMVYLSKVDASAPGGLSVVGTPYESETAKEYTFRS